MKKLRTGLIFLAVIWIIINLTFINYEDPGWSVNRAAYGQIMAFCILIGGLLYSIRYNRRKKGP